MLSDNTADLGSLGKLRSTVRQHQFKMFALNMKYTLTWGWIQTWCRFTSWKTSYRFREGKVTWKNKHFQVLILCPCSKCSNISWYKTEVEQIRNFKRDSLFLAVKTILPKQGFPFCTTMGGNTGKYMSENNIFWAFIVQNAFLFENQMWFGANGLLL